MAYRHTTKLLVHALLAGALCAVLAGCGGGGGGTTAPGNGSGASGSGGVSTSTPGITWSGHEGKALSNGTDEYQLAIDVSGLTTGQSFTIAVNATGAETFSLTGTVTANGTYQAPGIFYDYTGHESNGSAVGIHIAMPVTTQPSDGAKCQVIAQLDQPDASTGIAPDTLAYTPPSGTYTVPVVCSTYPAAAPTYVDEKLVPFPGTTAKVIASPVFAPVFFSGSTDENDYEVFLQQVGVSKYWNALAEYGVGNGTTDTAIMASTTWPSTVTESQIEQTIVSNDAWGAPITSNTVLVLFLPQGTLYLTSSADETVPCLLPSTDTCSIRGQVTLNGTPIQFIAMQPDTQNNGNPQYRALAAHLINAVTNPGGGAGDVAGDEGYVEASKNPDWYVELYTNTSQNQLQVGNACTNLAPVESDLSLTGDNAVVNGFTDLSEPYSNTAATADTTYDYCNGRPPYGLVADWSTAADAQSVTATRFGHQVNDEALVIAPGKSATIEMAAWQTTTTLSSYGDQPYFPLKMNGNNDWYYLTGTRAPRECQNGKPYAICADAPSFSITPVSTVAPAIQPPAPSPYLLTNGDTYDLTVTASSTSEPGMWVMYIGGQPIAVTNASTWQ